MTLILVLSGIGILAILAELVLPGGLLGILGGLCLIGAVVFTFVNYGAGPGIAYTIVVLVFGVATLGWWMKYFHRIPVLRGLILQESSGKRETPPPEKAEPAYGETGRTLTDLMPSGRALFAGRKLDVISEGPFVPKGTDVEIVARRGPSVIVRAVEPSPAQESPVGQEGQEGQEGEI